MVIETKKPAAVKPPSDLPEGFASVNPERAGWFIRQEANPEADPPVEASWFSGELIGRYPRKKGKGSYYQVKLTHDCKFAVKKEESDEESQPVVLKAGEAMNFDETSTLESLKTLTLTGDKWEIFVKCKEKVQLEGGNSFWRMAVGKKLIERASADGVPF